MVPEVVYASEEEAEKSVPHNTMRLTTMRCEGARCPYCAGPVVGVTPEAEVREDGVRYVQVSDGEGQPLLDEDGEPVVVEVFLPAVVVRQQAVLDPCGCVWDSSIARYSLGLECAAVGEGSSPVVALCLVEPGAGAPEVQYRVRGQEHCPTTD